MNLHADYPAEHEHQTVRTMIGRGCSQLWSRSPGRCQLPVTALSLLGNNNGSVKESLDVFAYTLKKCT